MNAKNKSLLENAKQKHAENGQILLVLKNALNDAQKAGISDDKAKGLNELVDNLKKKMDELNDDIIVLQKYKSEISHMKQGSISMMEQITTISKMRIYIPKKSTDTLFGISFSSEAMEKINAQLINLYLKSK